VEKIFGIPMTTIMIGLLLLFGLCLTAGAWVLHHRIIFRMGLRNVPHRPAQTILIVIGLMLSTLIIAAALTTGDTLNFSIKSQVYELLGHTDEMVVPAGGAVSGLLARSRESRCRSRLRPTFRRGWPGIQMSMGWCRCWPSRFRHSTRVRI
jgi:hypothetical protein